MRRVEQSITRTTGHVSSLISSTICAGRMKLLRCLKRVASPVGLTLATVLTSSLLLPFPTAQGRLLEEAEDDSEPVGCCKPPYAFFDCTGDGHTIGPDKVYTCVDTSKLRGCMSCLESGAVSEVTCSTCCSLESDADCKDIVSDWEFYASTIFFVCLCCCFSVLCGFTEVRRKKKGISFAEAWSVPHAMPILRTWPRRSVSVSDAMSGLPIDGEGWTPLSDDEDDLKRYPVAGLVDDSGIPYGIVTSMPQSLLGSVTASLRRQATVSPSPPPTSQEPELTVWISRDGIPTDPGGSIGVVAASSTGQAGGGGRPRTESSQDTERVRSQGGMVSNSLQEPLIFGDGGVGVTSVGGVMSGASRRADISDGFEAGHER